MIAVILMNVAVLIIVRRGVVGVSRGRIQMAAAQIDVNIYMVIGMGTRGVTMRCSVGMVRILLIHVIDVRNLILVHFILVRVLVLVIYVVIVEMICMIPVAVRRLPLVPMLVHVVRVVAVVMIRTTSVGVVSVRRHTVAVLILMVIDVWDPLVLMDSGSRIAVPSLNVPVNIVVSVGVAGVSEHMVARESKRSLGDGSNSGRLKSGMEFVSTQVHR